MQTGKYADFWQKAHQQAKVKRIPLRVMFELTYRCNFNCRHCYLPLEYRKTAKSRELSTSEVYRVLDQLRAAGCLYLGFTGGEPFMRGDILEIIAYACRSGFEVIIYTNGSFIDKKTAVFLAKLRINKVDITIPAMSDPVFAQITGVKGACSSVFQAISYLRKANVPVALKTCLLKANETEIPGIKRFCRSLKLPHRLDTRLSACLDGNLAPYRWRSEGVNTRLNRHQYESCPLKEKKAGARLKKAEDLFDCNAGSAQAGIDPFGRLKFCLMIEYPLLDILETGFSAAWAKTQEIMRNIRPGKEYQCAECRYKNSCNWCPARSWLLYRNFYSCTPEDRLIAQAGKG
jgi:radical SAM protein with 4Fe4S-binding SPASM domain